MRKGATLHDKQNMSLNFSICLASFRNLVKWFSVYQIHQITKLNTSPTFPLYDIPYFDSLNLGNNGLPRYKFLGWAGSRLQEHMHIPCNNYFISGDRSTAHSLSYSWCIAQPFLSSSLVILRYLVIVLWYISLGSVAEDKPTKIFMAAKCGEARVRVLKVRLSFHKGYA